MAFADVANPSAQPYKFGGKELDSDRGLNLYDFHARWQDPVLGGRFLSVDPLAEKYYWISPYVYCMNNPVRFVDPDGRAPRIYVETKGLGHTFITTGEGKNTVVYTYGRYGALNSDKSSSGGLSRNGEGVLIIMKGAEALNYIYTEIYEKGTAIYEVKNGFDEKVNNFFENLFSSPGQRPTKGKYALSENAKVIDEYDLFENNCTTIVSEAVKFATNGELDLNSSTPANMTTKLYYENKKDEKQVEKVHHIKIMQEYEKEKEKGFYGCY